ncbi:MAG: ABC transporter ATP-binding protein [Pseudomonadota bacterium]
MALEVVEVLAAYGRVTALRGLSARFAPGRLTAIVGPNGCGKSTLLKTIMGFVPVLKGEIWLNGRAIRSMERRALARQVAYLPQQHYSPDYMTLGELIALAGYARYSYFGGPTERDQGLFRDALAAVGLSDLAHRQVNALSGGQKQRAWIALVLAQDAELVLMDEPVNHLDMKYQYATLELVRDLTAKHGKTVVVVLHDLNLAAAFADDVIMLRDGRAVASGPVTDTINRSNVADVFDVDAEVYSRNGRMVCLPRYAPEQSGPA